MNNYSNSKSQHKVSEISSHTTILSSSDTLSKRCKFNFHYFTPQKPPGQDFGDWSQLELTKLLNKLKDYSEKSLYDWTTTSIGKGKGHVLEIYGNFPIKKKTDFTEPQHIPIEAEWGRFRLESKVRLIGFIIPEKYHDRAHEQTGVRFDKNTFYVVFLDKDHKFYKREAN